MFTFNIFFILILILGVIKFIGPLDDKAIAPDLFVGVRLDDNGKKNIRLSSIIFNIRQYILYIQHI